MSRRHWGFRPATLLLATVAQVFATAAFADTLETFQHSVYPRSSGAPGNVTSLEQDEAGFLWITGAASKGLVRFDGVSFAPYLTLPGQTYQHDQVSYIFPAEGGGMWMDSDNAGPSLARNGRLTAYGPNEGYSGIYASFYKGPRGHVRSISNKGIHEFADGAWKFLLPLEAGNMGGVDADGHEWILAKDELWVRKTQDGPLERPPGAPEKPWSFVLGASGRMYFGYPEGLRIYRRDGVTLREVAQAIPGAPSEMIESRAGALWVVGNKKVIFVSAEALAEAERTHSVPQMEEYTPTDGLSGSYAGHVLEDHDGNVWVGTENGLDVFRRTAFANVRLPAGMSHVSAVTDTRGNTWVASGTYPILRRHAGGSWTPIGKRRSTFATVRDPARDVAWALNLDGLWRLGAEGDAIVAPFPYPAWDGQSDCLAIDAAGKVHACPMAKRGERYIPRAWDGQRWSDLPPLPSRATTGAFDAQGVLWFALMSSPDVVRLAGDRFERVGQEHGLVVGPVKVLTPDGNGLWLGGDKGIQYFDGARFWPLSSQGRWPLKSIAGIVVDKTGFLWVQTIDGVLRSKEPNLASTMRAGRTPVSFDHFGLSEGVDGAPDMSQTMPALRMGGDGRLWLQTLSGLAWIDPAGLPAAQAPPSPRIDAVGVQGRDSVPHSGDLRLAADERDLRIAYSSATLMQPDRVRFAYRLAGLEDSWTDAGARREATFTNLPPGRFRFEVKAFLDPGPSSAVTTIGVERVPAFRETWWFRVLFVVPAIALVWLAFALRARAIARKLKIRAEEREAVARDIHDTLLQRFQGVMLTMQAWSVDAEIPENKRREMTQMSTQTRDVLLEGRERITILRSGQDHGLGLYDALLSEGQRLSSVHGLAFAVNVAGISKSLRKEAESELRAIVLEAMRNAFAHSGGSRVRVDIAYEADALWVVIADDGKGIDDDALAKAPQQGHYGMVGLRERASRLHGAVRVDSAPGEGTELHVRIPARVAYGK